MIFCLYHMTDSAKWDLFINLCLMWMTKFIRYSIL